MATEPLAAFAAKLAISPTAGYLRSQILARQQRIAGTLWPQTHLTYTGAFAINASLHRSTLDMIMCLPAPGPYPVDNTWAHDLNVANIGHQPRLYGLRGEATVTTNIHLSPKPVAVLKYTFSEARHGEVDVTVTFRDPRASVARDRFVLGQLRTWRGAREALVLLKSFTAVRGLGTIEDGGMGSYVLALSLVACLNGQMPGAPTPSGVYDVLTTYLKWITSQDGEVFGALLDPLTGDRLKLPPKPVAAEAPAADATAPTDSTPATTPSAETVPQLLFIRDPIDHNLIQGAASFRMKELIEEFRGLLWGLEREGADCSINSAVRIILCGQAMEFAGIKRPYIEFSTRRQAQSNSGVFMKAIKLGAPKPVAPQKPLISRPMGWVGSSLDGTAKEEQPELFKAPGPFKIPAIRRKLGPVRTVYLSHGVVKKAVPMGSKGPKIKLVDVPYTNDDHWKENQFVDKQTVLFRRVLSEPMNAIVEPYKLNVGSAESVDFYKLNRGSAESVESEPDADAEKKVVE